MPTKQKSGRPVKVPGEKSTRRKIFDAALELFAERGYDGVSIRNISAAVGIKESSIYKHYASKEEILEEIANYPKARIGIIGPPGADIEELIVKKGLRDFMSLACKEFTTWMDDPCMVKIFRIMVLESYHNEEIKKRYLELLVSAMSFWESNFRIMSKHGLIKPLDPMILAREFLTFFWAAYLDYFLFSYADASQPFPPAYKDNMKQHIEFVVNSIKP